MGIERNNMREKYISRIRVIALLLTYIVVFSKPAFAYIDPGTVSIVVQAIVAGLAGAAATARYWISWVKNLFNFSKKSHDVDKVSRE